MASGLKIGKKTQKLTLHGREVFFSSVVFFLLSDSLATEFYVPIFRNTLWRSSFILVHITYEDGTECSETSAHKFQTPGNHPKERIKYSRQGESLKSSF